MSGFPHNILHHVQEEIPPRLAPIVHRSDAAEATGVSLRGTTPAFGSRSREALIASPPRDDYAVSQFQFRPSSSSGEPMYRRGSAGSSAGSRPSTTASLNPTMQQLSTTERLPIANTLPPLRSVMGVPRPTSASDSAGTAMAPASTLASQSAWEQNRPRAASASSFTATPSHRGIHSAGRYDRSNLGRSALPDRYPMTSNTGPATSSIPPPNPTLTWGGSLRNSRPGPLARARSNSRPEPYAIPSGNTGISLNPLPGSHRVHSSALTNPTNSAHIKAQTGLVGITPSSRTSGGSATSSLGLPPTEAPSLEGFSRVENGRQYKLIVVQSPSRARMCGFGDKDRRPLSPTLIVKLVIIDVETGREVPPTDVDTSAFFLAADLVHPEELKASPRNLLIHQHAATVSTEMLHQSAAHSTHDASGGGVRGAAGIEGTGSAAPVTSSASPATFDVERVRARSLSDPWRAAQVTSSWGSGGGAGPSVAYPSSSSREGSGASQTSAPYTTVTTETYTRNFVGASVASANILKDENDQQGIFFVLQDLSVRTEGTYRIKLMFADLASSTPPSPSVTSSSAGAGDGSSGKRGAQGHAQGQGQGQGQMRVGISEALAETYTEPFVVYTPRRFPGVIEPTVLSRKFAAQGVKIPVRVDRKKRRRRGGAPGGGVEGEGGADGSAGEEGQAGGEFDGQEGEGDYDIDED